MSYTTHTHLQTYLLCGKRTLQLIPAGKTEQNFINVTQVNVQPCCWTCFSAFTRGGYPCTHLLYMYSTGQSVTRPTLCHSWKTPSCLFPSTFRTSGLELESGVLGFGLIFTKFFEKLLIEAVNTGCRRSGGLYFWRNFAYFQGARRSKRNMKRSIHRQHSEYIEQLYQAGLSRLTAFAGSSRNREQRTF